MIGAKIAACQTWLGVGSLYTIAVIIWLPHPVNRSSHLVPATHAAMQQDNSNASGQAQTTPPVTADAWQPASEDPVLKPIAGAVQVPVDVYPEDTGSVWEALSQAIRRNPHSQRFLITWGLTVASISIDSAEAYDRGRDTLTFVEKGSGTGCTVDTREVYDGVTDKIVRRMADYLSGGNCGADAGVYRLVHYGCVHHYIGKGLAGTCDDYDRPGGVRE